MSINVRLKDASGNVLHPETEWDLVTGKPSISITNNGAFEKWMVPDHGSLILNGGVYAMLSSGDSYFKAYGTGDVQMRTTKGLWTMDSNGEIVSECSRFNLSCASQVDLKAGTSLVMKSPKGVQIYKSNANTPMSYNCGIGYVNVFDSDNSVFYYFLAVRSTYKDQSAQKLITRYSYFDAYRNVWNSIDASGGDKVSASNYVELISF